MAIKVLPEAFAHDPARLSRFHREAKMLAALNHPNIATIHGLQQSGDSFQADKPQLWSPGQFTELGVFTYNFALHPDGKRFAVLKAPGTGQTAAANKVSFIFNFFDELRSKFPPGSH